jgi:hypothetical protein
MDKSKGRETTDLGQPSSSEKPRPKKLNKQNFRSRTEGEPSDPSTPPKKPNRTKRGSHKKTSTPKTDPTKRKKNGSSTLPHDIVNPVVNNGTPPPEGRKLRSQSVMVEGNADTVGSEADRPTRSSPGVIRKPVFENDEEEVAVAPLVSGDEIKFSLNDLLGKGSYGSVYKGMLRGTVVAIKELKTKYESIDQFKSEINIMTRIRHPNIILFLGACHDPPYIVTELLTGGDLQSLIVKNKEKKDFPMKEMISLAIDIARGMAWLHQSIPPIIHKDLKPTNIMIDVNGKARIIDFGLSEVQKEKEMQNRQGAGSLAWMSPEMLEGKSYTEKIDVYAYGIILWQMFTASPDVYDITKYRQYTPSVAKEKFTSDICDFNVRPDIPADFHSTHGKLAKLMEDCWEKEHSKRPSFGVILETLSPCLLSYALNDDSGGINMWSRYFKDKNSVPMEDFISALWRTVDGGDPPDPHDDGYVHLKCIEAVINAPGVRTEEVSLERFGLFIHWFGPLLPLRGDSVFQKLENLLKEEWFHGELSGPAAEELLSAKKAGGDFLVRCSLNPHAPYTMSRLVGNSIVHYRIHHNRTSGIYKMQYQYKKKDKEIVGEISGSSLSEFVKESIRLLNLKTPVKCTKFLPLFQKQKTITIGYDIAHTHKH